MAAERRVTDLLFDKPQARSKETLRFQRRDAAERLLESSEFHNVHVTETGIPGVPYDITVSVGPFVSLGGWRHAPERNILGVYRAGKETHGKHIAAMTDRKGVPDDDAAKAGVVEATGLAVDMALKWAIMRATIKNAREHTPEVYGSLAGDDVSRLLDASQLSGGKSVAVVDLPPGERVTGGDRILLMQHHADHINTLNSKGEAKHITAPDMGTTSNDMTMLRGLTPYVTSMSAEFGGSEEPAPITALGVFHGTNAMLEVMGKDGNDTTFAIQGAAGEVGHRLLGMLREEYPDAKIAISDIPERDGETDELAQKYNAVKVQGDKIFQQGGIFVPSGPSAQLNERTLDMMQETGVEGVIGPANSLYPPGQEQAMAQAFHDANILVAPAPLVNQGGIRNIAAVELIKGDRLADEQIRASIADVGPMTARVLRDAKERSVSPEVVFREIALDEFAALLLQKGLIQ